MTIETSPEDVVPLGDDGDHNNDDPPTNQDGGPPEYTWDPDCPDGSPGGCWVDDNGGIADVGGVLVRRGRETFIMDEVILWRFGEYTLGWINGQWQLLGSTSHGDLYLIPNVFAFAFPTTGAYMFIAIDIYGRHWMTTGNPYMPSPPTIWVDVFGGGDASGEYVQYSEEISGWLGFEFDANGMPISGTIPFLPGGGSASIIPGYGNNHIPGNNDWGVSVGFNVPFGNESEGDSGRHRLFWSWFVTWWYGTHGENVDGEWVGEWPPESMWPTHSNWWNDWVDGYSNPYGPLDPDNWPF